MTVNMDSAYVSQRQVVERYVRGTLTPEETEAFEIYMLEHPETAEDVEYERGLQEALAGAQDLLQPAGTAAGKPAGGFWLRPSYAMAATVLLAVTAVASVSQWRINSRLTSEIDLLRAPAVLADEIRLESMRGAAPLIVESRPGQRLLLSVAVDADSRGPYALQLRSADGAFAWNQADVEPGVDGTLRIAVRSLERGRYELTVVPADASRTASFVFELVPAE
jgi:hypothetical protein